MNWPIMRPTSTLSAPMKAVYLGESIFLSKRITGMPASYASSTAGVMVWDWFGDTMRRSTPSLTNFRIWAICLWLSSSADENTSLTSLIPAARDSSSFSFVRQMSSLHWDTPITSDFFPPPQAVRRSTDNMMGRNAFFIYSI